MQAVPEGCRFGFVGGQDSVFIPLDSSSVLHLTDICSAEKVAVTCAWLRQASSVCESPLKRNRPAKLGLRACALVCTTDICEIEGSFRIRGPYAMGPTSRLGHSTEHVQNVYACSAITSVGAPYSRTLQSLMTTLQMIYLHVFEGNTGMIDCCVTPIFTNLSANCTN